MSSNNSNSTIVDFSQFVETTPAYDKTPNTYIQQVINCNKLQSNYLDLELIHNKNFRPGLGIRTMEQLNQSLSSTPSSKPDQNKFEDFYQPAPDKIKTPIQDKITTPVQDKIATKSPVTNESNNTSYNDASNFNFKFKGYNPDEAVVLAITLYVKSTLWSMSRNLTCLTLSDLTGSK